MSDELQSIPVAALYVRADSIYRELHGVETWDAKRDARRFPGGMSVIAHPPCRGWGQMASRATVEPGELDMAKHAIRMVRQWGGVLEHPDGSGLWGDMGLPEPGHASNPLCAPDSWGGWTLAIRQSDFGHLAEKATRLYIVGVGPRLVPPLPLRLGNGTHVVAPDSRDTKKRRAAGLYVKPSITKADRERTPRALAEWLVQLARCCHFSLRNGGGRLPGGLAYEFEMDKDRGASA